MATANNDMMCSMFNTIGSMQQTVLGLQNAVTHVNLVSEQKSNKVKDNSLDTAMAVFRRQHPSDQGPISRSTGGYNIQHSQYGFSSD